MSGWSNNNNSTNAGSSGGGEYTVPPQPHYQVPQGLGESNLKGDVDEDEFDRTPQQHPQQPPKLPAGGGREQQPQHSRNNPPPLPTLPPPSGNSPVFTNQTVNQEKVPTGSGGGGPPPAGAQQQQQLPQQQRAATADLPFALQYQMAAVSKQAQMIRPIGVQVPVSVVPQLQQQQQFQQVALPSAPVMNAEAVAQQVSLLSSRLSWVSPAGSYQATGSPNIPRLRDMYHRAAQSRMNLLAEMSTLQPVAQCTFSGIHQPQAQIAVVSKEARRHTSRSRERHGRSKERHVSPSAGSRDRDNDRRPRGEEKNQTNKATSDNDKDARKDGDEINEQLAAKLKYVFMQGVEGNAAPRYLKKARFCQLVYQYLGKGFMGFSAERSFNGCCRGPNAFLRRCEKYEKDVCFVLATDWSLFASTCVPVTTKECLMEQRDTIEAVVPDPLFTATPKNIDFLVKCFFRMHDEDVDANTQVSHVELFEALKERFDSWPCRAKLIQSGCDGPMAFMERFDNKKEGIFYRIRPGWSVLEDHIMVPEAEASCRSHQYRLPPQYGDTGSGETVGFNPADLGNAMSQEYNIGYNQRVYLMKMMEKSTKFRRISDPIPHGNIYYIRDNRL